VSANGAGALNYQWRRNSSDIPGATGSTLTITNVQAADAGTYDVVVNDAYGSSTSNPAELRVLVPITFVQRPQSQTAGVGDNVTFTVEIAGNPPPFLYTWRRNVTQVKFTELSSERTASFTITNVQLSDAGNYIVAVSNAASSVVSLPAATLTVTNKPALNLSRLSQ
jgi:hypothetical protein